MNCIARERANTLIIRAELIAKGEWNKKSFCVHLSSSKGICQSKVISTKERFYICPEDALFLMHKGELATYFHGIIMSLQESYVHMIADETGMKYGLLYNFLSNFGYKICRHQPSIVVEKPVGVYRKDISTTEDAGTECLKEEIHKGNT